MKTTTVTEAKNRLSSLIDQVRSGETITILDRGTPVARLEPVISGPEQVGRLRRLARAGIVRVGDAPPPIDLIRVPPPAAVASRSALESLIEERRMGR